MFVQKTCLVGLFSTERVFQESYYRKNFFLKIRDCYNIPPVGGGLSYKRDRGARRLAYGCKFRIVVSLNVFRTKHQYF